MRYFVLTILILVLFTSCKYETHRMEQFEVHGIDVSHYQSEVNWNTVAQQGIHFAYLKATEGESMKDHRFADNWAAAASVGIRRGAYHFFRPSRSALSQALNFTKMVDMQIGDLPPVLDVELTDGIPANILLTRMQTWLDLIEMHYRVKPVIYTNQKFYNHNLVGHFEDYPLWIARYSSRTPSLVDNRQWDFWQYGNRGRLNGITGDVDFNVFASDLPMLESFCIAPLSVQNEPQKDVFYPL